MGEGKKRARAIQYRQSISKLPALEMVQASIFGGTVALVSDIVTCNLADGESWPKLKSPVQLVDFGKECVEVVLGVRLIGHVDHSGTDLLRNQYEIANRKGSRLQGEVVELSMEWNEFSVRIHADT